MPELWDTSGLFQTLLDDFGNSLNSARNLRTRQTEIPLAVKIAIVGFGQFVPVSTWGLQHFEFISQRLEGELSPEELTWYEECAESISVFSCLALGALLGKFQSGEIDEAGFTLGDAHLAGYISMHNEEICKCFAA